MRISLPLLLALLVAACTAPPRPAVAEPPAGASGPSLSLGGDMRALYGIAH